MKKLKKIELTRVNLNPDQKMSPEEMAHIAGSGGCICYKVDFYTNNYCTCDAKSFGLCNNVNGGPYQPTY